MRQPQNRIERLKALLKYFMETRNLRRMKGRLNTISLRNNSQDSLIVDRPDAIPPEYWRVSLTIGSRNGRICWTPSGTPPSSGEVGRRERSVQREPDNAKLRSALICAIQFKAPNYDGASTSD